MKFIQLSAAATHTYFKKNWMYRFSFFTIVKKTGFIMCFFFSYKALAWDNYIYIHIYFRVNNIYFNSYTEVIYIINFLKRKKKKQGPGYPMLLKMISLLAIRCDKYLLPTYFHWHTPNSHAILCLLIFFLQIYFRVCLQTVLL